MHLPSVVFKPPRWWLGIEFIALYAGVPLATYVWRSTLGLFVVPMLLVTGFGLFMMLRLDPDFDRTELWNADHFRTRLRPTVRHFLVGGVVLTGLLGYFRSDLLFNLPLENPVLWVAVMVLYPIWSVYPQEVIFRAYPFHRYRRIFPSDRLMILATAIGFGLGHLLFANWIAIVLSTIGGFLFGATYARTRSTLQSATEHALWGDLIFTIGLGWFFYGGSVAG